MMTIVLILIIVPTIPIYMDMDFHKEMTLLKVQLFKK